LIKILIVGDIFMKTSIVSEIVKEALETVGLSAEITQVEWEFKGYQLGRRLGIKKELREFAGNPEELARLVKDVEVLIVHVAPVTSEVIEAGEKLKIIGCARGNPVNVDVDAATTKNIPVIYTPGRNAEAVADYTIGLIIAYMRNIINAHQLLKKGIWNDEFYSYDLCGHELSSLTLGLIGFGRVGLEVAKRARAFNMKVIAYDPYVSHDVMEKVNVEKKESLEDLLVEADIVSIHTRLTPETFHMIGERELKIMKNTALLINTARGEVVDEKALIKALKEKWIMGAALDVFESEPLSSDNPLIRLDNVILTPHIAGASKETVHRAAKMLSEDIVRILRGEKPLRCANSEVFAKT
jgi:D-3-phosphoglycerate dehydrogenase